MSVATAPTIAAALDGATRRLAAAAVPSPRRDARLLLAHVLGSGIELLLGHPERPVDPANAARFGALIERRAGREPVSRLIGRREFWSLEFRVTPAVLDPRPDSETLVDAVLALQRDRQAPLRLLDLGTGSGCLLLALLHDLPRSRGIGVDNSQAALAVARENAQALRLDARAEFRLGDWAQGLDQRFDILVTNPPYIAERAIDALAPEVAGFDPRAALAGGADGLAAYRVLAPQIAGLLLPGGIAGVEVGDGQAAAVERLFTAAGLSFLGCRHDLQGIARCVLFRCG